jgi:hypothetical protein
MLHFDAEPIATSIPFSSTERNFFPSIVRSILGDMRRGREPSPMRRRCVWLHCGARIKLRSAME